MIRGLLPRAATGALAVVLLMATACGPPEAGLRPDGTVPGDLRALSHRVWRDFAAAFAGRLACIPPVTLTASRDLEDHARYQPGAATITVRVPATAGQLRQSLLHELAHHLESHCPAHQALRPAFLAAQGHARGAAWGRGPTWEQTPSEQWAEAVVAVVEGRRSRHQQVPVRPAAMDLVARWAGGNPIRGR